MVKLFSIAVLYRTPTNAMKLAVAYDLMSFGFFQRSSAQEFMSFSAKLVTERTEPGTRQSIKQGDHMCHCYVRTDNLAAVVISDGEYPTRVAHSLLMQVLEEFTKKIPAGDWASGKEVNYPVLETTLAKYQNPKEADSLAKMQADLDETRIIMHNTIEAVLQRGEKLDDLVSKSQNLSDTSKCSCCNWV
ncbi:synaptobrevin homolog YKT6-like [Artemia franciscana]|uniref:Uncharacterized protein n=1 Tax=Artemia franciscana TaxID=6661 RepID=A0AA88HY44_ARTSF|nr:hypothetical protein QYM36_008806 [Artemia franciscana]